MAAGIEVATPPRAVQAAGGTVELGGVSSLVKMFSATTAAATAIRRA